MLYLVILKEGKNMKNDKTIATFSIIRELVHGYWKVDKENGYEKLVAPLGHSYNRMLK